MVSNVLAEYRSEGVSHDQLSQDVRMIRAGQVRPVPVHLVERYSKLAVRHAVVELQEDGQWLARIEGFPGVWTCEAGALEALTVLEEVVFDWALLKMEDGDRDLPVLGDLDLNGF